MPPTHNEHFLFSGLVATQWPTLPATLLLLLSDRFNYIDIPLPRDWRTFCDILAQVPPALSEKIASPHIVDGTSWSPSFTAIECATLMTHLEETAEYL
jgi:hypothetical protein